MTIEFGKGEFDFFKTNFCKGIYIEKLLFNLLFLPNKEKENHFLPSLDLHLFEYDNTSTTVHALYAIFLTKWWVLFYGDTLSKVKVTITTSKISLFIKLEN